MDEELLQNFINACANRLNENLSFAFPNEAGSIDQMLDIARETAVIIAIEMQTPPIADTLYDIFERAIKENTTAGKLSKRAKRHRQ